MKVVERYGSVTTIVINRPERRNAVDRETAERLRDACTAFDADETAAVAVLCGAHDPNAIARRVRVDWRCPLAGCVAG
jgi:enoyl-CoA hydratase/carnithine racemase